jgi:polysaccharide biosynthesis/export protein
MRSLRFLPFFFILLMASCATKKEIIYFQDAQMLEQQGLLQIFEPTVERNDVLYINVTSLDPEVVVPFMKTNNEGVNNNQNPLLQGYLVDNQGVIRFPILGDVSVAGKNRGEIEQQLKSSLSEFIRDVVVDVRIMNFKVTVIGAVNNPGVYSIQDERVTIPQALGLAGDLSLDGNRNKIMVLREEDGKQKVGHIDLTQTEFFSSEYYFLKQNDIIYVEPSLKGVKKSGFIPDIPALLSLFTVILSSVILLTR